MDLGQLLYRRSSRCWMKMSWNEWRCLGLVKSMENHRESSNIDEIQLKYHVFPEV